MNRKVYGMPAAPTKARAGRAAAPLLLLGLLAVSGVLLFLLLHGMRGSSPQPVPGAPVAPVAQASGEPQEPPPAAGLAEDVDPPVPPLEPDPVVYPPDHVRDGRTATDSTLRGLVVAAREVPFPLQASLELMPQAESAGGAPRSVVLDAQHRDFRFDAVPFGDWKLRLTAPGYQEYEALITTTAEDCDQYLVLPLQFANRIRGRVFDAAGRPVAAILVCAERVPDDASQAAPVLRGVSDELGQFQVEGVSQGRYRVYAGEARSPLSPAKEVQMVGAEGWIDLVVPVTGAASVLLSDSTSGNPLAEVKVVATRENSTESGYSANGVSSADGRVTFAHLPPGEYSFTAYGAERRRSVARASVEADQVTQVPISMQALPPR